jgi:hypothetical protein
MVHRHVANSITIKVVTVTERFMYVSSTPGYPTAFFPDDLKTGTL